METVGRYFCWGSSMTKGRLGLTHRASAENGHRGAPSPHPEYGIFLKAEASFDACKAENARCVGVGVFFWWWWKCASLGSWPLLLIAVSQSLMGSSINQQYLSKSIGKSSFQANSRHAKEGRLAPERMPTSTVLWLRALQQEPHSCPIASPSKAMPSGCSLHTRKPREPSARFPHRSPSCSGANRFWGKVSQQACPRRNWNSSGPFLFGFWPRKMAVVIPGVPRDSLLDATAFGSLAGSTLSHLPAT